MAPSPADFAQIVELMEIKRLYEEQEERWRQRFSEKEELITQLEGQLASLKQEAASSGATLAEMRNQIEASRAEKDRVIQEANARIEKLNERIRDLNQQLVGSGKATGPEKPATGFFKR
jgi:septal ring factor EnvC (AmiA/AmiB activator)